MLPTYTDTTKENCPPKETQLTNIYHQAPVLYPTDQKIQKVPDLLRQEDHSGAYDPKVVSFGPYHYGKPELQTCEQVKPFAVQMFVEGGNQTLEFYYAKIFEQIPYVRSCYVEGSTNWCNDGQLTEMMLRDACFLIFFMNIGPQNPYYRSHLFNHLGSLVFTLVNRDIYLMENQIPFQILMLLINSRYINGEEQVSRFLHRAIWGQYKHQEEIKDIKQKQQQSQPLHLFDAFRRVLVWDFTPPSQVQTKEKAVKEKAGLKKRQGKEEADLKKRYKTFRSATDLKAKGIHFRPSSKKSLTAISFNSFTLYGQLELPTWFVTRLSKVFFPNMIAYELCPYNRVDTTVKSYISFMKSLIDSPADVKELREKRILLTSLGCDEDVVKFYKDLDPYGTANYLGIYKDVQQRIQDHYDSKGKTWMAQLINTYFSSPWSIIGWFAGFFLLVLTVVQTYYTVNSK